MKNWMKGLLITGVVLLLAGTAITAVAAVAGGLKRGNRMANHWIEEHIGWGTLERISDLLWISSEDSNKTIQMERIADVSKENLVVAGSFEDVHGLKRLEVEAERTAVRFEEREEASGGVIVYVREDPNFKTSMEWDSRTGQGEIRLSYPKIKKRFGEAVIEVPSGYRFEELELEVEAGYMRVRTVRADALNLDAEAAGITVDRFEADRLEASSKAGSLTATGAVERSLEVRAEAGAADIYLDGRQDEYDYEVKNAVGSVRIGESIYSGLSFDSAENGGRPVSGGGSRAKKEISVDCSVGSVQVIFSDDPD